jgi:hypothetical protein
MQLLSIYRRSPSPSWYATWRRRRERLRYGRGAVVRGMVEIWVPWAMREDPESRRLAAAAAREQLQARFPGGAISLDAVTLHSDERARLASCRFSFSALRLVTVRRRT